MVYAICVGFVTSLIPVIGVLATIIIGRYVGKGFRYYFRPQYLHGLPLLVALVSLTIGALIPSVLWGLFIPIPWYWSVIGIPGCFLLGLIYNWLIPAR